MILRTGNTGYAVESLQEMLIQLDFYKGFVSGIYDEKTTEAVTEFQKKNRLDPTGIADDRTQMILAMRAAVVPIEIIKGGKTTE